MKPLSDEDAIDLKRHELTVRCEDCGTEHNMPHEGGPIPDCCEWGDLRRIATQRGNGDWQRHENPRRDTVDGPPQLLFDFSHGAADYVLYVNGKPVDRISHQALEHEKPIRLVNHFLAAAHHAREAA